MAPLAVIVDQREPAWVQALQWNGAPTVLALLDAGDVHLATDDGCLVAIERKTATDLLGSIRDDRLWTQIRGLRALTPWAYLVICGALIPTASGKVFACGREANWNWSSVQGALLTVQELGVHVVYVPSEDYGAFEAAVLRLANRDRSALAVGAARETAVIADAEQVLMAFRGIGYDRAQRILNYCGTLAHALVWLTDDAWSGATEPPGIGLALKRHARKMLGLKADETLVIDRPVWTEQAVMEHGAEGVTA